MSPKLSAIQQIPEIREMIAAAQRYVDGETDFWPFYYAALSCGRMAAQRGIDSQAGALCREWRDAAENCRNEFGLSKHPITEQELKEVLRRSLAT